MKLSIIITTYNRLEMLRRALNSVMPQKEDCEVVVVDDCSTDGTSNFLGAFSKENEIVYVRRDKNSGVNSNRNLCINIAKGDWLAFLDDDDEFLPNAIKNIKQKISDSRVQFKVAYFNSLIDNGEKRLEGGYSFGAEMDYYDPTYFDTMTKKGLVGDCKPVFNKELFLNKNYKFPESVNGYESYLMCLLARDGVKIRYFKEKSTLVHFDNSAGHLSISAPTKKPWPLFVLHFKQISQHKYFYIKHPTIFYKKLVEMMKLLVRSILKLFF